MLSVIHSSLQVVDSDGLNRIIIISFPWTIWNAINKNNSENSQRRISTSNEKCRKTFKFGKTFENNFTKAILSNELSNCLFAKKRIIVSQNIQ